MPRTKPKPQPAAPLPPVVNGPMPELLTLAEAAAYLRLPEAEVLRLIREQELPAQPAGTDWRFYKTAIQMWLSQPLSQRMKKEIWAAAGMWKDDPYLEDMLEEIYRQRGRPITEDGSYRLFHGLSPESEQK